MYIYINFMYSIEMFELNIEIVLFVVNKIYI